MSFEERNAVSGILAGFIVWSLMLSVMISKTKLGLFMGEQGIQHWAQTVLWLILIGIGVAAAVTILFNVTYGMITGEKKTDFRRDERDEKIGLRGIQATLIVLTAAVILAIIVLAMGYQMLTALNVLLVGCALSSLASEVTKLYLYRRGF
jgi:hypothetical protein